MKRFLPIFLTSILAFSLCSSIQAMHNKPLDLIYQALANTTFSIRIWSENKHKFFIMPENIEAEDIYVYSNTVSAKAPNIFNFSKDKYNGWIDLVCLEKDRTIVEPLLRCMRELGGNEIEFANFLYSHNYFK